MNFLRKTEADDEPLAILAILESNGINDALWALRAVDGKDRDIRLMAADFAESVLHLFEAKFPNDDRPMKSIQAARDYANGLIQLDALKAASDAAWAAWAAWAAAAAASDAAVSYAAHTKQIEILKRFCNTENSNHEPTD
jgi:hypothetical protein